jgi:hypothetical protein
MFVFVFQKCFNFFYFFKKKILFKLIFLLYDVIIFVICFVLFDVIESGIGPQNFKFFKNITIGLI